MSKWLIVAILFFATFRSSATSDPNGRGRFFGWETVKSHFGRFFRFIENRIAEIFGESEKEAGRTEEEKSRVSYRGYQVLRVHVSRKKIEESLTGMSDEMDGIEFWTPPNVGQHADVLVTPEAAPQVKRYLKNRSVSYEVMIDDLQKLIAYENPKMSRNRREMLIGKRGHTMTWTMYHRFSDMTKYMEVISNSFGNLVELITIGYSSEGLPLKVVKVSRSNKGKLTRKMAVWIDGGMHGREWITSSVVLYIVNELVEKNKKYKKLIDHVDWYLMPVANPDGYEYSHIRDRLWKKTRSKSEIMENNLVSQILYGTCEGVDLNRNFDFRWGEYGSQDDPCSSGYVGPKPFSEPESKAISHFITDHKENLKIFITLHSYSQTWLMPSRYANNKTFDFNVAKMAEVAVNAIRGILGSNYGVEVSSAYYSGCSQEWAREVAGIGYAYQVELRDRAHYGFILPANQILPTAKETFTAVKSLVTTILSLQE